MKNSLTFDISTQYKTSDLQVSSAWLISTAPLHNGDTAHIKANVLLAEGLSHFSVRLLVFDTEWQCAFASPFECIDNASHGNYCINFYFLINLKPAQYLATFEFIRNNELSDDPEESYNLLGRYNSFIEFVIHTSRNYEGSESDVGEQGYIQQASTTSIYPLSTDLLSSVPQNGVEAVTKIPWPQREERISLNDLSAVLREISSTAAGSQSDQSPDLSVLTPSSYDRKFLAAQSPMSSKIGIVEGFGLRSNGSAGYLLFGPYLSALPGRYEIIFECRTGSVGAGNTTIFDVIARRGTLLLAKVAPVLPDSQEVSIRLEFQVESPGVVDLEFRMSVAAETDIFVKGVNVRSLLTESARATWKIERLVSTSLIGSSTPENLSQDDSEKLKRHGESKLVVIFIANQVFTICGLILAYHLLKKSNSRTILVSEGEFDEALSFGITTLCGIEKCVLLANTPQELAGVRVDTVITHAENSSKQTKTLLKQLSKVNSNVELQAYGDGFRNAANPQKLMAFHPVTKLYFLGVPNFSMQPKVEVEIEIVDFQTSQRILTRFAQAHNFFGYEPPGRYDKYSVFCLRYWGLHGYNFPSQLVGESWYQTIAAHTPKDELIIIKGGGGHAVNNEGYAKLRTLLKENDYTFIDAEDYLMSCGMPAGSSDSSLEYLLYFGLFRQVNRFFSLDSSVPIILSQLDYIPRPVEIVCGARNLYDFKKYSGFNVINSNMDQLRKSFANASFFDPFEVIEEDATCFTIKLV